MTTPQPQCGHWRTSGVLRADLEHPVKVTAQGKACEGIDVCRFTASPTAEAALHGRVIAVQTFIQIDGDVVAQFCPTVHTPALWQTHMALVQKHLAVLR